MTKILLVEDDKSLQEIYGVRLGSEGYSVLIAGDGEEALNIALKEKPDLILSDVMMPKISGFDMLEILRTTPEIQNTKVIIMTALSSDDQRDRGESLGADIYLVKSQVGIEDVVQAVKDLLDGKDRSAPAPTPTLESSPNISETANATVSSTAAPTIAPVAPETTSPDPNFTTNEATPVTTVPQENVTYQPAPTPNQPQDFQPEQAFTAAANNFTEVANDIPEAPSNQPSQTYDLNLNPQYRQPSSLRDIIPPRDLNDR